MKLPISLGNKLFFRVIAPGAVLASALARLTQTILQYYGIKVSIIYALPVEIIIFGLLFLILDMPIYMLFEGRRFWPSPLLEWGRRRERARLLSLHRIMRRYDVARIRGNLSRRAIVEANRRYLEATVDLTHFPLNRVTAMPSVVWPTRLGNLIAAYEQYPRLKYGLDAVFYWPRLWIVIEKDLREEIDNQQAQADGILYISTALISSTVILLFYAIVDMTDASLLMYSEKPIGEVIAAILCGVSAIILYRVSLYSHAQFGELFKSVFDQYRGLLNLEEAVDLVAHITSDSSLRNQIFPIGNIAAWRFLRWHRVRLPGETVNRRVRLP